jgi:hypothetical protein
MMHEIARGLFPVDVPQIIAVEPEIEGSQASQQLAARRRLCAVIFSVYFNYIVYQEII